MKKYRAIIFESREAVRIYLNNADNIQSAIEKVSSLKEKSETSCNARIYEFSTKDERSAFISGYYSRQDVDKDIVDSKNAGLEFESQFAFDEYEDNSTTYISERDEAAWYKFILENYPDVIDSPLAEEEAVLYKYLENDDDEKIIEFVEGCKYESKEEIVRQMISNDVSLFRTALEEYYKKRYRIRGL